MCQAGTASGIDASAEVSVPRSREGVVSVTVLFCILGWLLGWAALGRLRRVGQLPTGADRGAGCTVVIPARNEESSIRNLLSDLTSDPGLSEALIVVVDDHSTDRTGEIARSFGRVQVVEAPALPESWTGKSWACHVGVQATRDRHHSSLVFLDADVRVAPGALGRLRREQARVGGLVSVQPWHVTRRWYEQLSALFNVIAVMGTGTGDGHRATGAFGPVMVTTYDEYDRIGGHASVRSEVVEDLALAARFRSWQLPVSVLAGGRDLRFRMYPDGPQQLSEGWTKNFALGAGSTPPLRLGAIVLWVTAAGSAALAVVGLQGELSIPWAVGLYGSFVAQLEVMFRKVGRFRAWTSVLYPVGLVFFVAIFVRSLWRVHIRHSVTWRGRSIPTVRQRG
jgi:4,4'-diaponeurosporenoate glycosyltransferase